MLSIGTKMTTGKMAMRKRTSGFLVPMG